VLTSTVIDTIQMRPMMQGH